MKGMTVERHIRQLGILDFYPPLDTWLLRFVNWVRSRRTRTWLQTQAVIETIEVHEIVEEESGAHLGWRPMIGYRYQVNDVAYPGVARGEIWFYDELGAKETADSLAGEKIPIRYKPRRPAKSVYLPTDGAPPQLFPARPDPNTGLVIISLK